MREHSKNNVVQELSDYEVGEVIILKRVHLGRPTEENRNIGNRVRTTEVWVAILEKEVK